MRDTTAGADGAEAAAGGAGCASAPSQGKACPSGLCQDGALLLGVMTSSGRLAYVQPPLQIDTAFVTRARAMGRPEARFRFSMPCREAGCPQWTGTGCGVVDMALEGAETAPPETLPSTAATPLPACAIRRTCRWYFQRGAAACAVCPSIVADVGGTGTYRSTMAARQP